ncbi:MAG: helix-turn-helix domain-containing protein [Eubacteriales bacterium]|nr:helix-turn-helix domain-containing protein [Eubacteriales bacterium]
MISSQPVQNTLNEITTITDTSAVIFEHGRRIISAKGNTDGLSEEEMDKFLDSPNAEQDGTDYYYARIESIGNRCAVAVKKDSEHAVIAARILAAQIGHYLAEQNEKIDKDDFVKNLLLDNLLQIDIFNRARKLGVEYKAERAVYVIESKVQDSAYDQIKELPGFGENDFLTGIDEGNRIVVHEIRDPENSRAELKAFAEEMMGVLDEHKSNSFIAYGSVVGELKNVSLSYKEAKLAHDVRRIFYEDSEIISYNELGIGRLIYQLPINLCRMFVNEIFGGRTFDEFDEETLTTINKFFENNLNVSETSRQLFIHRNTLVYRLDKLQKTAGLDLRVFDDAITFKIALMVVKYIDYMDRLDY